MSAVVADLWAPALGGGPVDPGELADSVCREAGAGGPPALDFRTRLLVRDSLHALRGHWGQVRFDSWLDAAPAAPALRRILSEDLGPPGFPSLESRMAEPTRSATVLQFFRELGARSRGPAKIAVGRSVSLILAGRLVRRTEDVDVVDEVPAGLRSEHELLDSLCRRYGLRLAHFQSHYLPTGWSGRLHFFGQFGRLEVALVDVYDVFLSKLFSGREKDRDDLRVLAPQLDKDRLSHGLAETAAPLLGEQDLRRPAAENWYILYGENLPA